MSTATTLTEALAAKLQARGYQLATAESCTGGLIAATCTSLSGSSLWFERGWVTYSNQAKTTELGVDSELILQHGAVSEAVARAMASGALQHANAQVSVAVTGVAGPTGGSPDKPVGTVCLAWGLPQGVVSERRVFSGDRDAVRQATVLYAIERLLALLD